LNDLRVKGGKSRDEKSSCFKPRQGKSREKEEGCLLRGEGMVVIIERGKERKEGWTKEGRESS